MTITAEDLTRREVIYCASTLVWELSQRMDCLDAEDAEILIDLGTSSRDFEEAAADAGWEQVQDPTWMLFSDGHALRVFRDGTEDDNWSRLASEIDYDETEYRSEATDQDICEAEGWEPLDDVAFFNLDTDQTSEAEDWEELCEEQGIEPDEREAYEHWIVTNWMGEKLEAKGETVREFMGLTLWARGTTGQAVYLDDVIQEIAGDLNRD